MKLLLKILRRKSAKETAYWQSVPFETDDAGETVATALQQISGDGHFTDTEGRPVGVIRWECSCLQKKCGACAMVIGGVPRLACDTFLRDYAKKGVVTIEPLRKFPVVADLIVDRSILYENRKEAETWMHGDAAKSQTEKEQGLVFEASRCLACGCCLEVCPNYCPGEEFHGAAGFLPSARLLHALPADEQKELRKNWYLHAYKGCGKSLACKEVCPAGIDTEMILSRTNRFRLP